jgi:hypothetical protein
MELKVDVSAMELFYSTAREKGIKQQIGRLVEEAIEKAGNKDAIAELLMDLDRNDKTKRVVYFALGERQ